MFEHDLHFPAAKPLGHSIAISFPGDHFPVAKMAAHWQRRQRELQLHGGIVADGRATYAARNVSSRANPANRVSESRDSCAPTTMTVTP